MEMTQGQKIARIICIICSAILVVAFFLPYADAGFFGEYSLAEMIDRIPDSKGGPIVLYIWAILPAVALFCAVIKSGGGTVIFNFITSAYILYFNLSLTNEMDGGFSDMGIASTIYTIVPIVLIIVTFIIMDIGSGKKQA